MESTATERVYEQPSRRKRRKATLKNRKSFAESPSSPLRPKLAPKKKRRREEETQSETFYKIKGILEEKRESGRILYLIDWEDNLETGERYDRSWEPREHLTEDAIADWERRKSRKEKTPQRISHIQSSTYISDPDSQPIRSAKRQRLDRRANLSSPTSKKPRRAGTAETARFQSVSQEESLELASEIKDSYEEELSNDSGRIRVVVRVNEDFDRDAYAKPLVESSQLSQPSQPSQTSSQAYQDSPASRSEPFSQHSRNPIYAAPRFKTPKARRGPFLWDEDIPFVIPDSQDLPGSSSFKPSSTPSSKGGTNSRPITGYSTEGTLETPFQETQIRSSYISSELSGIDYRRSEPPSYQPRRGLFNHELQIVSKRRESSANPSSSGAPRGQLTSSSSGDASQSQSQAPSNQSFATERTEASGREISSRIPICSGPVLSRSEILFEEAPQISSQASSSVSTNLATTAKDAPGIDKSTDSVLVNQSSNSQLGPNRNSESPTLEAGSRGSQSLTQATASGFEASWQAAQIVPLDQDLPESTPPQKQINYHGSEDVLESIEPREDTISIPPRPSPPSPFPSSHSSISKNNYPGCLFAPLNTADMSDQNEGIIGVAEILRRARADAAANTMARQERERTERERLASVAPAISTPAASQMLPLRDPTSEAPVTFARPVSPSPKSSPETESKINGLQILPLGPAEYAVPLPMVSVARSMYTTEIDNHRKDIKALIENNIDSNGMSRIRSAISNITLLCDHQDLVTDDTATQQNYTDLITANYAENVSTKCQLIAGLLKDLRSSHEHIAILVRPGRMTRILEAMCRHYEIDVNKMQGTSVPSQVEKWPLKITIIPTSFDENNITAQPASLVVAFDSSFKPGKYSSLRAHPLNPSQLVPLVHLVIAHSIEHLELCIDEHVDPLDRIRALIDSAYQTREDMGKLDADEYLDPEVAGKAIAEFVIAKNPTSIWPLLPMPEIEGLDLTVVPIDSQSRTTQPSGSTIQSHNTSSPAPSLPSAFKRPLGVENLLESSKRQKLTLVPDEQTSSSLINGGSSFGEINLVRSNSNSTSNIAGVDISVANSSSVEYDQNESVPALLLKVARLEQQIQAKESTEAELRQFNQQLESRCKDYENSMQTIQPKYQEALNDQGRFQHELTEALRRESNLRQKYDASINTLAKLREDKAAADAELNAARATMATSTIPEILEFSKLKTDLRTAQENTEKLQKRLTNMQSEVDYMRNQYQTASTAAADSASELSELKEENTVLHRKASDNARQIHKIQASSEIRQHLERIEELENEKTGLEIELGKKTEELKASLNGRRSTRGTSVPRSPRMGTMSPNVRSERPMARVLSSGVGSRGNSPAPGDAAAPFRATFGDALFAEKGVGRWANHLT